jgi:endonuclease YncB( thermonuclease family)
MILLAIALYATTPYVIDGDTVVVKDRHVRVLQVNTPEKGECYAEQAKQFTQGFLAGKGKLTLVKDPVLDVEDQYGRSLRYVFKGKENLSLELVRKGYAKPMFFNGDRGKYADLIMRYAGQAKAKRLGLWSCKGEGNDN